MHFNLRHIAVATFVLILMFGAAVVLEKSVFFSPLQRALRADKIPTAMINYGVFGRVVSRLGLFTPAINDNRRFDRTEPVQSYGERSIFQKKRVVGDWLFEPADHWYNNLPSTKIMSGMPVINNCPVISITVNEADLTGPEGIFTHYDKHGRKYERLACVSYFEDGKLQFETHAGIRIHGGRSRVKKNSYRLYFRKEYGIDRIDPGLLFEEHPYAIKRLVVRYDHPADEPFTSCLAFDISNQLGCAVPSYKSTVCYLNGEDKGIYFIAEHLGRKQWEEHLGHQQFDFARIKSTSDPETVKNYQEFVRVFSKKKGKFTMEFVSQYVDLENFTDIIIAMVFCGTTDGLQGVAFRNRIIKEPRWSWISWDLDHSFVDTKVEYSDNKERQPWQQPGMQLAFSGRKKKHGLRRNLFFKIITEDPQYRKYFLTKYLTALNHVINEDYLNDRLDYYQGLADRMGLNGKELLKPKKDFLAHRPQFIREQLRKYFKLSSFNRYEVRGPDDIQYIIDGHPEHAGYIGYYPKKIPMQIEIASGYLQKFSHWQVNGAPLGSGPSEQSAGMPISFPDKDATITPVFTN